MENSKISWTHHTYNPWAGCTKVSPGCKFCYAVLQAARHGTEWGPKAVRRIPAQSSLEMPRKWNRQAESAGVRFRVFCSSMADVFEDNPQLVGPRQSLWALVRETPHLDYLVLTKRPQNIASMLPDDWGDGWKHVWLGTSVESQEFTHRIRILADVPCHLRFLSCEPLLGPLQLDLSGAIHWVITGGESGRSAKTCRPMDLAWVRDIRDQCRQASVAFFHKQLGGWNKEKGGRLLDGLIWDSIPISPAARSESATATRSRRSSAKWERMPVSRRLADRLAIAAAADGMSRRDLLEKLLSGALDQREL